MSKSDILPEEKINRFKEKYKDSLTDLDEVKRRILSTLEGIKEEQDSNSE
jgi:hypothetical protein